MIFNCHRKISDDKNDSGDFRYFSNSDNGQQTISTELSNTHRPFEVAKRLPVCTSRILIGQLGIGTHIPSLPSSILQESPSGDIILIP